MLNGQSREAALKIPAEELTAETGVNKLLEVLDELYLKDAVSLAYEAYEAFEKDIWQSMIISFILKDFTIRQKGIKWKYMMGVSLSVIK